MENQEHELRPPKRDHDMSQHASAKRKPPGGTHGAFSTHWSQAGRVRSTHQSWLPLSPHLFKISNGHPSGKGEPHRALQKRTSRFYVLWVSQRSEAFVSTRKIDVQEWPSSTKADRGEIHQIWRMAGRVLCATSVVVVRSSDGTRTSKSAPHFLKRENT